MSVYEVLTFPDPRLRQVAREVETVTDEIKKIAEKMLATMYAQNGAGLASIQVNILHRMFVMDCSPDNSKPYVLINPVITHLGEIQVRDEGCLSFPGVRAKVERAKTVRCEYLDENGEPQVIEADGTLAQCIQHEIDHLNGKLFFDYLSPLKQLMMRDKLKVMQKIVRSNKSEKQR